MARWASEVRRFRSRGLCMCVLALLTVLSLAGSHSFLGPQNNQGKRKTPSIEAVGKDPMGAFRDVPTAQTAPEDEHKALKDIGGTMISLVFWAVFIRAIVIEEHYLPYQEMRTSLMMEGMGGSQIHVFPTD
ncbi:hypothetical protein AK812_SmicGene33064 [Symbiodinium microadriaticum]|uniref:Uncharacterized protein n=1 Tax=Symbiodinium microadriaticum TaxID=2951 RepID=A0A1Q9CSH1_SYMMI|nr:hypothetical protein AK812_SmicGene33064 [Symbiodinium microadriaticum]